MNYWPSQFVAFFQSYIHLIIHKLYPDVMSVYQNNRNYNIKGLKSLLLYLPCYDSTTVRVFNTCNRRLNNHLRSIIVLNPNLSSRQLWSQGKLININTLYIAVIIRKVSRCQLDAPFFKIESLKIYKITLKILTGGMYLRHPIFNFRMKAWMSCAIYS